ncbi:MAG: hypothetical protein JF607_17080 [Burkholderiales bacterium]|jgi:hypothetical protein|nr:hypothetical protein [Burkholderiales bacterium]MBW8891878.1 hypothetical protein [Burkholderiales bacterium]
MSDEARLAALVRATPWFMATLRAGRELGQAHWCIGAGALRNLVESAACSGPSAPSPPLVRCRGPRQTATSS